MHTNHIVSCLAFACALGVGAGGARAHSTVPGEQGAATLHVVQDANLIIVGEVVSVEYRLSELSRAKTRVPQTLVTYQVIMPPTRGKFAGEQLVLRFPGGSDGMGHFVDVEGAPRFQRGERDVLFIRSNGEKGGCALVECEWGRFRLLLDEQTKEQRVYDALGRPIFLVNKAVIKSAGLVPAEFRTFSFPRPDYDSLIKNPEVIALAEKLGKRLDDPAVKKEYEANAPPLLTVVDTPARRLSVLDSSQDGTGVPNDNRQRKPIFVGTFLKTIEEINAGLTPPRVEIVSVDPKAPLIFESSRLSVPPTPIDEGKPTTGAAAGASAIAQRAPTRQEARELKAMQENGGDPVIHPVVK